MNKLLLEKDGRHHIKIMPVGKDVVDGLPTDEGEGIKYCEKLFQDLESSALAEKLYEKINKPKGYLISVWAFGDKYYLIQDIKNEFDSYNDTIYISKNKEDMIAIAGFLAKNINFLMSSYKKQIVSAKKRVVPGAFKDEDRNSV